MTKTKDRVLSVRIKENMFEKLEELSAEFDTETVSQTVRKILNFYFFSTIYEEEWKKVHSESFEKFVQEVAEAGNKIELQKYNNLVGEASVYVELIRDIFKQLKSTISYFEGEQEKFELVVSKLENASLVWNGSGNAHIETEPKEKESEKKL